MRRLPRELRCLTVALPLMLAIASAKDSAAQFRETPAPPAVVAESEDSWLGQIFWTSPAGESISALRFFNAPGDASTFEVTEDSRFKVLEKEMIGSILWLKVAFIDDAQQRTGYLMADHFRRHSDPPETPFFQWSITSFNISAAGPPSKEIRALRDAHASAEKKQMEEVEEELRLMLADRQSRPPRIGMTADQARASSWGEPKDVNRTTVNGLVREQWVFPWGYVYLENQRVTAIQD